MISLFNKLNLRPVERRLVVGAALVLFAVINFYFVVPRFGDWKDLQKKIRDTEMNIQRYMKETNNLPAYLARLEELQTSGEYVPTEEAALSLAQTALAKAAEANILVQRQTPAGGGDVPNNPFFTEQRVTIYFTAGEKELVDFLIKLGSDKSLIRVRDMDIKPDPQNHKLVGSVTLIGRFQKKPLAKSVLPKKVAEPIAPDS
ncbi:MAG: hypothetical protein ACP5MG_07240 [Verrucomicrobiia bacterium]|jgi:hypothetical protein